MGTLDLLKNGEVAVVHDLTGGRGFVSRACAMGLTPNTEVTVVQNFSRGPLIILLRGSHVALGRGEARKIQVRKKESCPRKAP